MSKKIKILAADEVDLIPLKKLQRSNFSIESKPGISNSLILKGNYDVILIRSTRKIDKEFIKQFSGKVIATFSKGTDHIDIKECKGKGIKVLNSEKGNSTSAAEHTFALILAATKNLLVSNKFVREDKFSERGYQRNEIRGKKLGIIGYGSIGKIVYKFGENFGMKVYANDIDTKVMARNKRVNFKNLSFILKNCDIVTIHIPLTKSNIGFIDAKKLSLLKDDCILVNTSRGEVIDEPALLKILIENKIRCACLDVFKGEPDINFLFFKLDNVILSNHVAGKTPESKRLISSEIVVKLQKLYRK